MGGALCGSCISCPASFPPSKTERFASHISQLHHYHKLKSWSGKANMCCGVVSTFIYAMETSAPFQVHAIKETKERGFMLATIINLAPPSFPLDTGSSTYFPSSHHCYSLYTFSELACYAHCFWCDYWTSIILPIKHVQCYLTRSFIMYLFRHIFWFLKEIIFLYSDQASLCFLWTMSQSNADFLYCYIAS